MEEQEKPRRIHISTYPESSSAYASILEGLFRRNTRKNQWTYQATTFLHCYHLSETFLFIELQVTASAVTPDNPSVSDARVNLKPLGIYYERRPSSGRPSSSLAHEGTPSTIASRRWILLIEEYRVPNTSVNALMTELNIYIHTSFV
jgi:hypothetical protein